jgi:glycosyltransferase involved in cell wall biosynthesis
MGSKSTSGQLVGNFVGNLVEFLHSCDKVLDKVPDQGQKSVLASSKLFVSTKSWPEATMRPVISICIPCFNNEEFIVDTLESVLNQTFADFEVLVVDDKSTDKTVALIERYDDHRLRLIRNQKNLGLVSNWKKALSQAEGKYVKLLCGDDLLHPECLARQVALLEQPDNSSVILAVCNRTVIDGGNKAVMSRCFPFGQGIVHGAKLIRRCVRWGSNLIGEPAVGLFRKQALECVEIAEAANPYSIDLTLWAELLKHGDAFLDNSYLAAFRVSRGSASAEIGWRQAAYFRTFAREMANDAYYQATAFDLALGCALSFPWCLLRNLFIRSHSGQTQQKRFNRQTVFSLAPMTDAVPVQNENRNLQQLASKPCKLPA